MKTINTYLLSFFLIGVILFINTDINLGMIIISLTLLFYLNFKKEMNNLLKWVQKENNNIRR